VKTSRNAKWKKRDQKRERKKMIVASVWKKEAGNRQRGRSGRAYLDISHTHKGLLKEITGTDNAATSKSSIRRKGKKPRTRSDSGQRGGHLRNFLRTGGGPE